MIRSVSSTIALQFQYNHVSSRYFPLHSVTTRYTTTRYITTRNHYSSLRYNYTRFHFTLFSMPIRFSWTSTCAQAPFSAFKTLLSDCVIPCVSEGSPIALPTQFTIA